MGSPAFSFANKKIVVYASLSHCKIATGLETTVISKKKTSSLKRTPVFVIVSENVISLNNGGNTVFLMHEMS